MFTGFTSCSLIHSLWPRSFVWKTEGWQICSKSPCQCLTKQTPLKQPHFTLSPHSTHKHGMLLSHNHTQKHKYEIAPTQKIKFKINMAYLIHFGHPSTPILLLSKSLSFRETNRIRSPAQSQLNRSVSTKSAHKRSVCPLHASSLCLRRKWNWKKCLCVAQFSACVSGRSSQVCGRQHVVWVCRWLHAAFCSNALAGPYFTPKTKEMYILLHKNEACFSRQHFHDNESHLPLNSHYHIAQK